MKIRPVEGQSFHEDRRTRWSQQTLFTIL